LKAQIKKGAYVHEETQAVMIKKPKSEKLNSTGRVGNIALEVDRPVLPVKTFTDMKTDLLTQITDEDREKLSNPEFFFLDINQQQAIDQDTVIMASYPRSGNTNLRAYMEKVMGLTTGSDCDITKKLNRDLMTMGLAGEGLCDKRTWVVKVHFPERWGKVKFWGERAILLVRNPLDCITSLFNMVCTGTHNLSISEDDYVKYVEHWDQFVRQEIGVWKEFHEFWLQGQTTCHIIRYEDVQKIPKESLSSLMEFMLNEENIKGTKIEHYINLATQTSSP